MWLGANVFHIVFDVYTRLSIALQLASHRAAASSGRSEDVSWTVVGCCDTLCMLAFFTSHTVCPSCVIISVEAGILSGSALRSPDMLIRSRAHCGAYLWVCGHCGEEVGSSEEPSFYLAGMW